MGKIKNVRMKNSMNKKRAILNLWPLFLAIFLGYSSYEWYLKKDSNVQSYSIDNLISRLQGHAYETKIKELKKINPDVLGVLEILNTDFEQVFVQSKDNKEYLTQDIYKEKIKPEFLFLIIKLIWIQKRF